MRQRLLLLGFVACSGGGVNSNDAAKAAYLGLDESIDKAIGLGFAGFNAASSANIPNETTSGDISGTMTVNGQVDQGVSANRQMRLNETLTTYADVDGGSSQGIVYNIADAGPATLDMSLQGIPNGTVAGSLNGTYAMSGTLQGNVTLTVNFNGTLQPTDGGVERVPGHTQITGTATSGNGTYTINFTR
jgi:hypothetical protein